ncbi:MAG: adenylate kinase [Pseudonocardiales bacterium]
MGVSLLPVDAQRILVYGVTGSGKSVLAERVSRLTGIQWHPVDELTWEPGWVAVPIDEQRRRIEAICERPEWILDTAYAGWLDVPLARVQAIVGLDYPRWFSLQRLVRRTFARLIDRRPVCNGNHESLRGIFSRDAIIAWHFKSFPRKRERIRQWSDDPLAPPVIRLSSARQTRRWLAGVAGQLR